MRTTTLRSIWTAATLCLAAAVAFAASDLATEVGELRSAADARVQAIGTPAPDKATNKEAKKLGKTVALLDTYTGTNDIADFKRLGKAGKQLVGSGTADATVVAEVGDVLRAMADQVNTQAGLAADALAALTDPNQRAKIDAILAKAEAKLDTGLTLIDTDPPKAHAAILAAFSQYGQAITKAAKFAQQGSGGGSGALPSGLTVGRFAPYSLWIENASQQRYFIQDVRFTGTATDPDGAVSTFSNESFAALAPEVFEVTHYPDGGFFAQSLIERVFPGDPARPMHDLMSYLYYLRAVLPQQFVTYDLAGRIEIVASKKISGAGPLVRFTVDVTGLQLL